MGNPIENAAAVEALKAEVKSHCMCLHFQELADRYRVIYPDGFFPNGVQASFGIGKAEALHRMLVAMEQHWQDAQIR